MGSDQRTNSNSDDDRDVIKFRNQSNGDGG